MLVEVLRSSINAFLLAFCQLYLVMNQQPVSNDHAYQPLKYLCFVLWTTWTRLWLIEVRWTASSHILEPNIKPRLPWPAIILAAKIFLWIFKIIILCVHCIKIFDIVGNLTVTSSEYKYHLSFFFFSQFSFGYYQL